MKLSDFSYSLPSSLIAESPVPNRSASRLMCLNTSSGEIEHGKFSDILDFLHADDLLVFNNTRVIPARLFAQKESGGRVEILIERLQSAHEALVQIRASKSPRTGARLLLCQDADVAPDQQAVLRVSGREDSFYLLQSDSNHSLTDLVSAFGHMPLPPYIKRNDNASDAERYQTVYASKAGAVAAPTAGLHFDEPLLAAIASKGTDSAFLTLHVGAGTFQPVRVNDVAQHKMHKERVELDADVVAAVKGCKQRGGRVIAVGTTSVRSLESAAQQGELQPFFGETDIFIYPGFEFKVVDAMITNFHLPESTLLMLVSAFASKKMLLDAYDEAIAKEYRFFSYGDAMFLHHDPLV